MDAVTAAWVEAFGGRELVSPWVFPPTLALLADQEAEILIPALWPAAAL